MANTLSCIQLFQSLKMKSDVPSSQSNMEALISVIADQCIVRRANYRDPIIPFALGRYQSFRKKAI